MSMIQRKGSRRQDGDGEWEKRGFQRVGLLCSKNYYSRHRVLIDVYEATPLSEWHTCPHPRTHTHTTSPLTEGMKTRKNLGAPIPIQANAAHQELLVHWWDLRSGAIFPLCHSAQRGSCHSHQPVLREISAPEKQNSLPHHANHMLK